MTSGYSIFSKAVRTGMRLKLWKTKPIFSPRNAAAALLSSRITSTPATSRLPPLGLSKHPIKLSRVVFPLPEGPTKQRKELGWMSKLIPWTAFTCTLSVVYVLLKFLAEMRFIFF
jgi:hypothetical protein